MSDLNKLTVIGDVFREPQRRARSVIVTVAARSYAGADAAVELYEVEAFGKLGEIVAHYVKRGDKLYIEGRLRGRSVEQSKAAPFNAFIVADNLMMLGHRTARTE